MIGQLGLTDDVSVGQRGALTRTAALRCHVEVREVLLGGVGALVKVAWATVRCFI